MHHAPRYSAKISQNERPATFWWADVVDNLPPRVPRTSCRDPDYAPYTDAASITSRIDALFFKGRCTHPISLKLAASATPHLSIPLLGAKNVIFCHETVGPIALLSVNRKQIDGGSADLYIDNNVLTSLARGGSGSDFFASKIACFWRIAGAFAIDICIDRVNSRRNPSVHPARRDRIPIHGESRV